MKKVFLYLYPIQEYASMFLYEEDRFYDEWQVPRPFPILNECIARRYRKKGYQIVYALYPGQKIFGIIPQKEDKVIYTDISFSDHIIVDENGEEKKDFTPLYPNELFLLKQLGDVDKLVIGGFHFSDCVRRVAEKANQIGIPTQIDLDMTDLFFSLYRNENYLNMDQYDPEKFKKQIMMFDLQFYGEEVALDQFHYMYANPVYGFFPEEKKLTR